MTETDVVELVRVSTEAQAQGDRAGIPGQRAANRETCARFRLRVVETVEIIESGATVATSPEMGRVLDMVRSGRVQGIVLAAYDRLFRPDNWNDLAVLQVLADMRAQIYVPAGPIDLRTEVGFITASTNNLLAGLEKRRIRERTMRAKEELRRAGKLASGSPPFGVAYSKAGGWAYTDAAETVRAIFRLFLSGAERSYADLGERFGMSPYTVQTILRRPIYAGWLLHEPREMSARPLTHGRKLWPSIDGVGDGVIRNRLPLEPIVSVEDFLTVQAIMDQRRERVSLTRESKDEYLYRGMLECSCGMPIYGIQKRGRQRQVYRYYGCRSEKERVRPECTNKHMVRARVEAALDGVVSEQLRDPKLIAAAVEAYNQSARAAWRVSHPSGEVAERRRRELKGKRQRVAEAWMEGLIERGEKERRLAAIDAQLAGLAPGEAPGTPPELRAADVRQVVRVFARWRHRGWQARRGILEALGPTFVLYRYRIEGVHLGLGSCPGHQPFSNRAATGHVAPAIYFPLGVAC